VDTYFNQVTFTLNVGIEAPVPRKVLLQIRIFTEKSLSFTEVLWGWITIYFYSIFFICFCG